MEFLIGFICGVLALVLMIVFWPNPKWMLEKGFKCEERRCKKCGWNHKEPFPPTCMACGNILYGPGYDV